MSHFAKVLDGKVIQVIVAEPDFFNTFVDSSPGQWLQTSYNTRGNIHYGPDGEPDGGVALRGNYAGIGYTYDGQNDVFYAPQPYASWTLGQTSWLWEPPVAYPDDGELYAWDEATVRWKAVPTIEAAALAYAASLPPEPEAPKPTLEDLQAQLASISAQIQAMATP